MRTEFLPFSVKNVTNRTSNPFGMRAPFERQDPGNHAAVYGYGDANADFHLIGDHPGVHGGERTGIPFTETDVGNALQDVAREFGCVTGPRDRPTLENLFWSYIHMCSVPGERNPTPDE